MATDETAAGTAAYMPWGTFTNTLDALAVNIPNRIDKSVFQGQSGGVQSQLINGFRFLGLINEDGKPQPALAAVAVSDEAARKVALKKIIEQKYAGLFALNLTKTTPSELQDEMTRLYNVSGDTRLKAIRFFLTAATYLGIPISPLLTREKAGGGNAPAMPRRRRAAAKSKGTQNSEPQDPTPPPPPAGTSRVITLRSGGTLTVSASIDLFKLNPEDRAFVFKLIDELEKYETNTGSPVK